MKVRTLVLVSSIAIIVAISSAFVLKVTTGVDVDAQKFEKLKSLFIKSPSFELSEEVFGNRSKEDELAWANNNNSNVLTTEFKSFLPFISKSPTFSRMPIYYMPVQMIETDKNFAFIYRRTRGFSNVLYDHFFVTVTDKKGNAVHHEDITGENESQIIVAFKIDKNLQLTRRYFRQEWKESDKNELTFLFDHSLDLKEVNADKIKVEREREFTPISPKKKVEKSGSSTRAK